MADLLEMDAADSVADDSGVDVDAVIAKYQDKLFTPSQEADAPAEAAPEAAQEQEQASPAEAPPPAEEPKPEQVLSAKRLAALARKEAELAAEREQLTQRIADTEKRVREAILRELATNPIKFAAEAGIPKERLGQVATMFQAVELGDDAPPEVRTQLQLLQLKAELDALKQPKAEPEDKGEKEPTPEFRAQVMVTEREINSFVDDVPQEMPYLAAEAENDPEGVRAALYAVAAPIIRSGRWPSAKEVARALDTQLRSDYERLSESLKKRQSASSTQTPPSEQKAPPTTLSDADVTSRASKRPEAELSDEEYIERAIRKAEQMGGLFLRR